jgi:hypothetical protein
VRKQSFSFASPLCISGACLGNPSLCSGGMQAIDRTTQTASFLQAAGGALYTRTLEAAAAERRRGRRRWRSDRGGCRRRPGVPHAQRDVARHDCSRRHGHHGGQTAAILRSFPMQNDHFAKTDSGHTQRRLQKKRPFGCTFSQVWTAKDKPNLSWSHPWCSAPANIVPRRLMGVQPLAPGYVHFEVYPQPAQLAWATLSLPTTRGKILLRFNQTASVFNASLTIPQGSTARVCLPPPTAAQVRGKRSDFAPFSFGSETILCPDRLGTTQYET